jgi:hypothetical protein
MLFASRLPEARFTATAQAVPAVPQTIWTEPVRRSFLERSRSDETMTGMGEVARPSPRGNDRGAHGEAGRAAARAGMDAAPGSGSGTWVEPRHDKSWRKGRWKSTRNAPGDAKTRHPVALIRDPSARPRAPVGGFGGARRNRSSWMSATGFLSLHQ